jgi:hypothetical protein
MFISQGLLDESGGSAKSAFPILVADAWGTVHAFWVTQFHEQTGTIGDTVYYAWWDGTEWYAPSDIVYTGKRIGSTKAAVDAQGWLHLVWRDDYYVWYSCAPVAEAASARSWSDPLPILDSAVSSLFITADAESNLHLVYAVAEEAGGVYYSSSSADEETWSDPVLVWALCDYCGAELALDGLGRIHVAFGSQLLSGEAVYYSRSDDGGQTWLPALEVDRVDAQYLGEYGPTLATVAAVGEGEVHFIWDGAPAGQRWHQWSFDGGDTWSAPQQISPVHRGLAGRLVTAVDSRDVLHLVSMGWLETSERPQGVFHTSWQNNTWSALQLVSDRQDLMGQHPALTVVNGNVLHTAWTRQYGDDLHEIWAASLPVDAPFEPPLSEPTVAAATPTPDVPATVVPVTGEPVDVVTYQDLALSDLDSAPDSAQPVLIGFAVSLFFVALVVLVSRRR